jgi:type II secretory pathway predicted ATPase ExeA
LPDDRGYATNFEAMNLAATGLRRQPFQTHGTPSILVPYASQQAALRFLNSTCRNAHGLGLFHGPPLSGKTSIIRHFTASLPKDFAAAVVHGAGLRAHELLQDVLHQFGYDLDLPSTNERFNMVRVFAMQQTANGCAPLLVVEKAHQLKPDALEALCEFAAMTVNGKSALRMILVSEKPMLPIMQSKAMRPISQRMTGKFLLRPLTREETATYVHRKLISGGCSDPARVVPRRVCDALHAASGGWPGVVDGLTLAALAKAKSCPIRVEHVPRRPGPVEAPAGVTVLRQPQAPRRAVEARNSAPRLILTSNGRTLEQIALDKPRLMVGRADHNELCIKHEFVSRQHAIFLRSHGMTLLLDLKSRNGTCVNGKRIASLVLVNNDVVSIGEHRIKFIDPAARQRTTLKGAGFDETTIAKSIGDLRDVMGRMKIV